MPAAPRTQLPPRLLPVLYFGVAHVAFALACLAVALDPRGVSGFFYHSRMLAIVHLVTLGWITASILGSLYIVGPVALRVWIPATWLDYTAFALVLIGIVGMVAHFWLQEYGGMAWSAITVGMGIILVGVHVARCLRQASLPRAISAHIMLAFLNILAAATLGVLIGFDKVYHFLPGFVLANVFAHAHLAALGWATMMVVGVAYRLLPMILPAAMPSGPRLWLSAVLLQTGVTGLFVTLLWRGPFAWLFALIIVGALAAFFSQVVWMLRRPRPRPPKVRTPDPAVLHAGASFVWLAVATVLGVWLTVAEPSPNTSARRDGVRCLRPGRIPGADGRRHGRAIAADLCVVLGLRQYRIQGPRPVAARDAMAQWAGTRVRAVAVRRARAGGRPRLRCHSVRQRRRMVLVRRVPRRHSECDPDPALRVPDAVFGAALKTTRSGYAVVFVAR